MPVHAGSSCPPMQDQVGTGSFGAHGLDSGLFGLINLDPESFGPINWALGRSGSIWKFKADILEAEGRLNRGLGRSPQEFGPIWVLLVALLRVRPLECIF